MLKNINRITSYIMRSDFQTPITVVIDGAEVSAKPHIMNGKIGVVVNSTFYRVSRIQAIC